MEKNSPLEVRAPSTTFDNSSPFDSTESTNESIELSIQKKDVLDTLGDFSQSYGTIADPIGH
jgi:hypothetical protein